MLNCLTNFTILVFKSGRCKSVSLSYFQFRFFSPQRRTCKSCRSRQELSMSLFLNLVRIHLQNLASMQPGTSLWKFGNLDGNSEIWTGENSYCNSQISVEIVNLNCGASGRVDGNVWELDQVVVLFEDHSRRWQLSDFVSVAPGGSVIVIFMMIIIRTSSQMGDL